MNTKSRVKRKKFVCQMRPPLSGKLIDSAPNGIVMRDHMTDKVCIWWYPSKTEAGQRLSGMTSADARLLAKRINQFLDDGG